MFGLVSACAVLAVWLRLRIEYHDQLGWDSINLLGILSLGCLTFWLAQISRQPRGLQWTLLAMALILSAIATVNGIGSSYMFIDASNSEQIRLECNASAIVNYGFVFVTAQAAVMVFPVARASIQSRWFLLLVTAVTVNIALLVLLCNMTAPYFP